MCNLNVIVLLEFINKDLYLRFVIVFSSKFRNSIFYQLMRPKSGLKSPRPLYLHLNDSMTESKKEEIEDIYFFEVSTKYISSSELKI